MVRKRTNSKSTSGSTGSSGYRGTWNPDGNAMYLDGKKWAIDKQLRTICLPLDDEDKKYLRSINSPELGLTETEISPIPSKSQEDTLLEAEVRAELEGDEDAEDIAEDVEEEK